MLGKSVRDPIDAWRQAVAALKDYCQGPGVGREPGRGRVPGSSRWPEANAVRAALNRASESDAVLDPISYFPRADLNGLPKIFQQMTASGIPDPTLQATGDKATRMASPVILKPLALAANRAVPMVLLFNAPHLWDDVSPGVALVGVGKLSGKLAENQLFDSAKSRAVPEPLLGGHLTAREAFLAYVQGREDWNPTVVPL